jgi:hypothetical protein
MVKRIACFFPRNARSESEFAFYLDESALVTLVSVMNVARASAVALTIQFSGDWRPLPMNRSVPRSRITRNTPPWCSTSRVRGKIQRGEDQAAGSGRSGRSTERRHRGELTKNDNLIRQKTCRAWTCE